MTTQELIEIHRTVNPDDDDTFITAANMALAMWNVNERVSTKEAALGTCEAPGVLPALFYGFLHRGDYVKSALLAWGDNVFTPEPRSVQLIWKAIENHKKILALGGTAQGKTYSGLVRYFLRWLRDPQYTLIKLISTSGGHAFSNIYSHAVRLHRASIIPFPGLIRQDYIGLSTDDMQSAISRIAIREGESGSAALRGFHPSPRKTPHPVFGRMSYSIAILDEAEGIPEPVWKGVDNIAATENVAVYAATNPVDITSQFGVRAEPFDGGWGEWDRENATEWNGQQGWRVLRLDPAKSENVVQKRIIYGGFMDFDGFNDYEAKGVNDPDYDTYGRGRYPMVTIQYNVVPTYFLNGVKSVYNFVGDTHCVASLDPAFEEGGDQAILTTGRYGLSDGFLHQDKFTPFPDGRQWCLQVEQQFPLLRKDTEDMCDDTIEICRDLHVRPEWFVMDSTGNGTGVRDRLRRKFGEILWLMWGAAATDRKILGEDLQTAEELYQGMMSEMWFAFARWLEFGYVKMNPDMNTLDVFRELTGRKYERTGKTLRKVESKKDYKGKGGKSPDRADSLIMLVHICRMRGQGMPEQIREPLKKKAGLWDDLRSKYERKDSVLEYIEI